MNTTKCVPRLDSTNHCLSRQLILTRNDHPFGSEIRINFDGSQSLCAFAPYAADTCQARSAYNEVLMQTRLTAFALKDLNTWSQGKYLNRRFICVEQSALINETLTEELVQCSETLRALGQILVIALNELPLLAIKFTHKKKILHNLYQLKDHGIEFAYNGFNINYESIEIFTTLNLFDYIKISLSSLEFSLKINSDPELFNRLYERMTLQTHNTKVCFIADRVEHAASHVLARALPFDYFQGSHYSPAENI